jgi:hypothetical protein
MSLADKILEKNKVDVSGRTNIPTNKFALQDILAFADLTRANIGQLDRKLKGVPDTTDSKFNIAKKKILSDLDTLKKLVVSIESASNKILREY